VTLPIRAGIRAIEYYLPETRVTNAALADGHPTWTPEKLRRMVGIEERRVAAADECASDLAAKAADQLFESGAADRDTVDFLIFCTEAPDYFLPASACVLQDRLRLPTSCGSFDISLGCSGYVYGLGVAKGLIETGQAQNVLFLTGDTLSKFMNPRDLSVRSLCGDAGTATFVTAHDARGMLGGPFAYGTDGSGAKHLMVPTGGLRERFDANAPTETDSSGNERTKNDFYMNGPEIFAFSLRRVPPMVDNVLAKAGLRREDVDLFVMHQASGYMLSHLRGKMGVASERFVIDMADCGNTASSSIPIALRRALERGALRPGMNVMLVGFGVGYSWGATLVRWE
jgi:3-oxoacyl-[acyl-carrier-protein] synthase-3